jgi:transposase
MHENTVIAVDIAKHIFQAHTVDEQTGEIVRTKLRRKQVLEHFARLSPVTIAMEACGSAHWWARQLMNLGHQVTLLPPRLIRAFVLRNKTDAADAQAIWTAAQQPGIKAVAVNQDANTAGHVGFASDACTAAENAHHAEQRDPRTALRVRRGAAGGLSGYAQRTSRSLGRS